MDEWFNNFIPGGLGEYDEHLSIFIIFIFFVLLIVLLALTLKAVEYAAVNYYMVKEKSKLPPESAPDDQSNTQSKPVKVKYDIGSPDDGSARVRLGTLFGGESCSSGASIGACMCFDEDTGYIYCKAGIISATDKKKHSELDIFSTVEKKWIPCGIDNDNSDRIQRVYANLGIVYNQLVLFGGIDNEGLPHNEIYTFDFTSAKWEELSVSESIDPVTKNKSKIAPLPRYNSAMCAYGKDSFLIFGGNGTSKNNDIKLFNDVWLLHVGNPNFLHFQCIYSGNSQTSGTLTQTPSQPTSGDVNDGNFQSTREIDGKPVEWDEFPVVDEPVPGLLEADGSVTWDKYPVTQSTTPRYVMKNDNAWDNYPVNDAGVSLEKDVIKSKGKKQKTKTTMETVNDDYSPLPRESHCAAIVNDYLIVLGGLCEKSVNNNEEYKDFLSEKGEKIAEINFHSNGYVELFDIELRKWHILPANGSSPSGGLVGVSAHSIGDNKLLLLDAEDHVSFESNVETTRSDVVSAKRSIFNSPYILEVLEDTTVLPPVMLIWSRIRFNWLGDWTMPPQSRVYYSSCYDSQEKLVYIFGGYDNDVFLDFHEARKSSMIESFGTTTDENVLSDKRGELNLAGSKVVGGIRVPKSFKSTPLANKDSIAPIALKPMFIIDIGDLYKETDNM